MERQARKSKIRCRHLGRLRHLFCAIAEHIAVERSRWSVAWVALLVLLMPCVPAAAQSGAQSSLQVSATILTMIKVNVLSQASQITIEQRHLSQGYIDVGDATVLRISSNSPNGFMMSVTHDPAIVSRVSTRLSADANSDAGEGLIPVRTQVVRNEPMRVSYRIHLNPHARLGNQPWPLSLSFTPRSA